MKIRSAQRLCGRLRLPGDKAVSHRAAIIAALARGQTRVRNFSTAEDCATTLRCLNQLGVRAERVEGDLLQIEGVGLYGLRAPAEPLDCGNSGSTMRMLAGVLAGQDFETILTGDESLSARPMKRIIEPLEMMGARFESDEGHAPLRVRGRKDLLPITYRMPVASAQVKTSILLAGLYARGHTRVEESLHATRDHTERMLRWFGVPVETTHAPHPHASSTTVSIEGGAEFNARALSVPGDISSAAFFIVAAMLMEGSRLEIKEVGLNSTRAQFLETLTQFGASLEIKNVREVCNEPVGDVIVTGRDALKPSEAGEPHIIGGALIPRLIDELPILAVAGTQIPRGLTIRDARELRFKESDRISATVTNLRAMGAQVEEHEDGLTVAGPVHLGGARLDARRDHRIAMAFTIAALLAEGESEIVGAESVAVSFPEFYTLLESVVER